MKKSFFLISTLCLLAFWGCATDEEVITENTSISQVQTTKSTAPEIIPSERISNQVVIHFKNKNIPEEEKQVVRSKYEDRFNFSIQNIETCDCDNDGLELWTVQAVNAKGAIEELVKSLSNNQEGESDMDGNYQFSFQILNDAIYAGGHSSSLEQKTVISNSKDAVNIAILDTGIDYDYFPERFLYRSSSPNGCTNEISGWDFINNDHDPRDDNTHGTFVTKIITDILDQNNTPYQILPVKAFDQHGKGTFWSVICGMNYIAKKPGRFIVNTSFGYYGFPNQNILKNIIENVKDRMLFISSAGNEGIDTDLFGNEHFPSSFDSYNLLTVGGYIQPDGVATNIDAHGYIHGLSKAPDSNYGFSSIDVLAPFSGYRMKLVSPNSIIKILTQGTSFGSALTSARTAGLFFKNKTLSPVLLKKATIETGYRSRGLFGIIKNQTIIVKNMINSGGQTPVPTPLPQS
ncbi:S8 family peptidase [Aquimarina aquimarini]|uniref:S8 family peptidase n=1 Tax=Aquimarina aquimarini TaxID=1191734 RepID=UPI00131F36DD|nr:S8 family serine peptidase [Aquimarina aquimarini]